MKPFQDIHIAVLAGGPGSERKVSLASGEGVLEALKKRCGHVQLVDLETAEAQVPEGTDLAFNVIHGTFGEDGELQSQLDAKGIAYTGAGAASSRLAFDKIKSKQQFLENGVKTPKHQLVTIAEAESGAPFLPCVVKPPCEGSSVGVHIVESADQWADAVADAGKYAETLMVEQYVKGKELTVGILTGDALPIIHIHPVSGFYDINNKYPWLNNAGKTEYYCPADLPPTLPRRFKPNRSRRTRF